MAEAGAAGSEAAPAISGLPHIGAAEAIANLVDRIDLFLSSLPQKLAPRPQRFAYALRLATICAVGMGLMVIAHVDSIFAPYVLWTLASGADGMTPPRRAIAYLAVSSILLALSVPIAGNLSEAPWLMLPVIGCFVGGFTYLQYSRHAAAGWNIVEIVVLTGFFSVLFDPHNFGWEVGATYGGIVIALLVVALFDNVLWPVSAEATLERVLTLDLSRMRERFSTAARQFLNPTEPGSNLRLSPAVSELAVHLAILERAAREGADAGRRALLLAAITHNERVRTAINRMIFAARKRTPYTARGLVREDVERAAEAIAAAMVEAAQRGACLTRSHGEAPSAALVDVADALAKMDESFNRARPAVIRDATLEEVANLGAFTASMQEVAVKLERGIEPIPETEDGRIAEPQPAKSDVDQGIVRYAIKLGVSVMATFTVAIVPHNVGVSAALSTVVTAGLPTYGATLGKMILRLLGAAVGGAIGLLAIALVSPNFETLPVFMLTMFAILFLSGWIIASSGGLSYFGRQIGSGFVFAFATLNPADNVFTPLWRVWGIILGMIVLAAVFIMIWPEYASESMMPRLRRALALTIDLIPRPGAPASPRQVQSYSMAVSQILAELLSVASDARMEGLSSRIDPDAVVDACGTVRRIAHRMAAISADAPHLSALALKPETEASRAALDSAMRERLNSWLAHYESRQCASPGAAVAIANSHDPNEMATVLKVFVDTLVEGGFAQISAWAADERRAMLAEVESYQRLVELFAELDAALSKVLRA